MLIVESKSKLNQLQKVDIALQELVLIVRGTPELPNRLSNHSRKLCVLNSIFLISREQKRLNDTLPWPRRGTCERVS